MNYLITQIWICLLIAAAIGAVIGWLLRGITNRKNLEELDQAWRQKFNAKQPEQTQTFTEPNKNIEPVEELTEPVETSSDTKIKSIKTDYDLEEIEGIGKTFSKKLHDIGITSTLGLVEKCSDLDGRIEIANHIGIEDFVIQTWGSMADLLRVGEIDSQYAELMVYAGVDSVQQLGEQEANAFHSTLKNANDKQQRVKDLPEITELEAMITEAKSLPTKIKDL